MLADCSLIVYSGFVGAVAQINAPPPLTPSHEEPDFVNGRISPEYTDGDVGAFEGLCVPQAANERREVYRCAQRVRWSPVFIALALPPSTTAI